MLLFLLLLQVTSLPALSFVNGCLKGMCCGPTVPCNTKWSPSLQNKWRRRWCCPREWKTMTWRWRKTHRPWQTMLMISSSTTGRGRWVCGCGNLSHYSYTYPTLPSHTYLGSPSWASYKYPWILNTTNSFESLSFAINTLKANVNLCSYSFLIWNYVYGCWYMFISALSFAFIVSHNFMLSVMNLVCLW